MLVERQVHHLVLDDEDRLVEDGDELLVRQQLGVLPLFGMTHVGARGEVAEKVGAFRGPRLEQCRYFVLHDLENLADRVLERAAPVVVPVVSDLFEQRLAQASQHGAMLCLAKRHVDELEHVRGTVGKPILESEAVTICTRASTSASVRATAVATS